MVRTWSQGLLSTVLLVASHHIEFLCKAWPEPDEDILLLHWMLGVTQLDAFHLCLHCHIEPSMGTRGPILTHDSLEQHKSVCSLDNSHLNVDRHGHNNKAIDLCPQYGWDTLVVPHIRCHDAYSKVQQ